MKIEILFNQDIFKKQMLLHFEIVYRHKIEKINRSLLLVSLGVLIYIPLLFIITVAKMEVLYTIFLLLLFYTMVKQKLAYNTVEKKYKDNIEAEIKEINSTSQISYLTFDHNNLRWENYKMDVRFKWEAFTNIRCIDTNLFFDIGENHPFIILGADEIGAENYQALIHILTDKKRI